MDLEGDLVRVLHCLKGYFSGVGVFLGKEDAPANERCPFDGHLPATCGWPVLWLGKVLQLG